MSFPWGDTTARSHRRGKHHCKRTLSEPRAPPQSLFLWGSNLFRCPMRRYADNAPRMALVILAAFLGRAGTPPALAEPVDGGDTSAQEALGGSRASTPSSLREVLQRANARNPTQKVLIARLGEARAGGRRGHQQCAPPRSLIAGASESQPSGAPDHRTPTPHQARTQMRCRRLPTGTGGGRSHPGRRHCPVGPDRGSGRRTASRGRTAARLSPTRTDRSRRLATRRSRG